MNWEAGIDICAQLCVEQIASGKLPCNTGNSAQCCDDLEGWDSCCYSVIKSCLTLCNPMDGSISGFPVFYYLPKYSQTHVFESVRRSNHLILCHPIFLSLSSLSQHQGLSQ